MYHLLYVYFLLVNVDVWLKSAQAEALAVEEEEASQRSPSTQSLKTEATAAKVSTQGHSGGVI